jgi:hypothetical protein
MTKQRPLLRWTIGHTTPDGYESLRLSIESFLRWYDADVVICHNCPSENLQDIFSRFRLIDQHQHLDSCPMPPMGVAWKLYPPRLAPERHEILIDNDLIINERIPHIDDFLSSDCTLLLEDHARCYGRFENHVAPGYRINSGLYGMPPLFNLQKFVDFYAGSAWEINATCENKASKTFDEQGLVAIALLSYHRFVIIPNSCITNCEREFVNGLGHHFIGLNRLAFHKPFRLYKCRSIKFYL